MSLQPNSNKIEGKTLTLEELLGYFPSLNEVKPLPVLKAAAADAAAVRHFKKGEVICEEGAFGSTAFYIISGKVDIFISSPMAHIRTKATVNSFFNRTLSKLSSVLSTDAESSTSRRFIPVDAPVDLDVRNPVAQLEAGDLFGEMTCRTFQPRSATVHAAEDCVIVEVLRVILDMLFGTREVSDHVKTTTSVKVQTFKGTSFKKDFDEKYRQRALQNHLSSVELFATIGKEFLDYLVNTVKLETVLKGKVICSEGDEGDAFYLIRNGMVRVSKKRPGGEVVLNYLTRGEFFGEISLITEQKRTATCTALDTVDLVKIDRKDFSQMLAQFPKFQSQISEIAKKRMETGQQLQESMREEVGLEEFLDQGLLEAQNLLIIDLDKCTRCDLCVQACAESHEGASRLIRDGLRYDKYLVPTACRSCKDPLCMTQCPVGAIRRTNSLEIKIEDWCTGCNRCEQLCPYGNITMQIIGGEPDKPVNPSWLGRLDDLITSFGLTKRKPKGIVSVEGGVTPAAVPAAKAPAPKTVKKATTCDLCMEHDMPSCVYACPHDAAKRVNPATYFAKQMPTLKSKPKSTMLGNDRTTHTTTGVMRKRSDNPRRK